MERVPRWNCFHPGGPDYGTTSVGMVARRVNIAAVATEAGVGIGTKSRVINGSPNVRATTRRRVLDVIERLNYRPSRLAAGLSRGRTGAVGMLVPFLTRPSVVERLAGAIGVFDEQGYDTVVFNVETRQQRDHHVEALLSQHRADGVMVFSLRLAAPQLAAFKRAHVPLSMVDVDAAGVPSTVIDDVDGGRLATAHLLELGHRRIGFVGDRSEGGLGLRSGRRRLTGYSCFPGIGRHRRGPGAGADRGQPPCVASRRVGEGAAEWALTCRPPGFCCARTPRPWGCWPPPPTSPSRSRMSSPWWASTTSRRPPCCSCPRSANRWR